MQPMVFTIKAYAKINLALNVFEKMDDGYHDVDMISIPLALHDVLELETLPKDYDTYITSDDEDLPTDESNLSYKAYLTLKKATSLKSRYLIHIHKKIPMQAGLAGGSADAAAVINAINKMAKLKLKDDQLIDMAKTIGGDVAFCLFNHAARCQGIGGDLSFFNLKTRYHVLLIKPNQGVSTAQAYHDFDNLETKPETSNIERMIEALENGDDKVIAEEMKNSLYEPACALVPEIKEVLTTLKKDGFAMSMMSGSGSTVFALSRDYNALLQESHKFDKSKFKIVLTQTL